MSNPTGNSRDPIAIASLAVGVLACIAAYLALPPVQGFINSLFSENKTPVTSISPTPISTKTPIPQSQGASLTPPKLNVKIGTLNGEGLLQIVDIQGNLIAEQATGITGDVLNSLWSPNGQYLLVGADVPYLIDTYSKSVFKWGQKPAEFIAYSWSPSSDRIAASIIRNSDANSFQLDLVSIDGRFRTTIYSNWFRGTSEVLWSPSGQDIYVTGGSTETEKCRPKLINSDTGEIKEILPKDLEGSCDFGSWLPDGRLILRITKPGKVFPYVFDPVSNTIEPFLKQRFSEIGQGVASPSGTKFLYPALVSESPKKWTLYIEDLLSGSREEIWTSDKLEAPYPTSWSPTETYVTFFVTDTSRTNYQGYLIDLTKKVTHKLNGVDLGILNLAGVQFSSGPWINPDLLVIATQIDQSKSTIALSDSQGNELKQLCMYDRTAKKQCAIWIK